MTTRRWFFRLTAAVAALPGAAAVVRPATAAAASDAGIAGLPASKIYDYPAIDAALGRSAPHRQVFAVARVADGAALNYMKHAIEAYETTMGMGPGSLHAAGVFYSYGVALGLNDHAWTKYGLVEAAHHVGETLTAPGPGNPFGAQFAELARHGATFFVCDNAIGGLAGALASKPGSTFGPSDAIRADLRQNLLPGALLVPAGVAALNMAQEAHFTYVQATL